MKEEGFKAEIGRECFKEVPDIQLKKERGASCEAERFAGIALFDLEDSLKKVQNLAPRGLSFLTKEEENEYWCQVKECIIFIENYPKLAIEYRMLW